LPESLVEGCCGRRAGPPATSRKAAR
jgi:hypothetical protein